MENGYIDEILLELGWDKGISIPVANASNKELFNQINENKRNVMINKHEILSLQDKLGVIDEHKRTARLERSNCESVISAMRNDINTEIHLRKLSERELGRIKQDIERVTKAIIEFTKRRNLYENMNYTKSMELESIKETMNWDQQDLEKYLAACNKQEDLAHYLTQYTRQDTSKAAVLEHQIAELNDIQNKARKKLDDAVIETKILQVELDKSAEEYRKEHGARKDVIKMWQNTIEQLIRRDKDLLRAANDLNDYRAKIRKLDLEVAERRNITNTIIDENIDFEKRLNQSDKDIAKWKEEYGDVLKDVDVLRREFDLLKTTIERTGRECEVARVCIRQLQIQRKKFNTRVNSLHDKTDLLQEKLEIILSNKLETEKIAEMAEENLKEEKMYINQLNEEMIKLREKQYKLCMELNFQQITKKDKEAEILTFRANLRNLISRKGKCEADLIRLDELIYKTDLNIQSLEHRIATIEGDSTSADMQTELRNKITLLTDELENNQRNCKQLSDMVTRFLNESRIHRLNIEKLQCIKVEEDDKIVAEEISIDNAQLQLKRSRRKREETLVFRNLENFQLKKLKTQCKVQISQVTTLEMKKESLYSIINERRVEIQYYKEILLKDLRQLNIDKDDIHKQLNSVSQKLSKMSSKYEVVSNANQDNKKEGIQGVIEAALEKEIVQKYGDGLDHNIRKTEKEIRALENTVILLNTCNESYRYLYTKTSENSTEQLLQNQAEADLKAEIKMHSLKRCELRMLLKEAEKLQNELDASDNEYEKLLIRIEEIKEHITRKEIDIQKMYDKIERAINSKVMIKAAVASESSQIIDIKMRVNNYIAGLHVMEVMQIVVRKFPDIWEQSARSYFENFNFEIPPQWRTLTTNYGNTQRSTTNTNNNRSSSRTVPMSVVNVGATFGDDTKSICNSSRASIIFSDSSTRSSVKLKLKNQGLEPFSSRR